MKTFLSWLGAVVAIVICSVILAVSFPEQFGSIVANTPFAQYFAPVLPPQRKIEAAHWLDQNWSTSDRYWFHHASQGTATLPVPYDWFVALEQPDIGLFPRLFKESDYLERFGFIPSPSSQKMDAKTLQNFGYAESAAASVSNGLLAKTPADNPDGLPVGFARTKGEIDATGQRQPDAVGLTCAACHTGHIEYKSVSIRYDGGPAMVDLKKLESAVGISIFYTLNFPGRFDRFAERVLGPAAKDPDKKAELKGKLSQIFDGIIKDTKIFTAAVNEARKNEAVKDETLEGFGRLDALNRIGNQVFYTDLTAGSNGGAGNTKNIAPRMAPVSFPPIWTVPWLSWAQYDASIGQPLIRNAGEALGVSAIVRLVPPEDKKDHLFHSSVAVNNLYWIEMMLRGSNPFQAEPKAFHGLLAPKWPAAFFVNDKNWEIDPQKVTQGRKLYRELCVGCHLGPVNDPAFDQEFPEASFWTSDHWHVEAPDGSKVLQAVQIPVAEIGTDPGQSEILQLRRVELPKDIDLDPIRDMKDKWGCNDIPDVKGPSMLYSLALMMLVDRVDDQWFEDHNTPDALRKEIIGPRKNCPNPAPKPVYKARPLDGIWATAPYLHNGSVPSLWWLLSPAMERPKSFCLGARDYDPIHVGFDVDAKGAITCASGETLFTTNTTGNEIPGNSVLGHSFEGEPGPRKPGVIGRKLTDSERFELIEYLKTL